jgi:coenzyme PQQ precursor peptide PqqA
MIAGWSGALSGGVLETRTIKTLLLEEPTMKTWTKPAVREQEVGLEVTSYLPAEIDVI